MTETTQHRPQAFPQPFFPLPGVRVSVDICVDIDGHSADIQWIFRRYLWIFRRYLWIFRRYSMNVLRIFMENSQIFMNDSQILNGYFADIYG